MAETKSGVTLMSAYKAVWSKYTDFSGRLSRKGYWYFVLVNMAITFVLGLLDQMIFKGESGSSSYDYSITPFTSIYNLAVFLPFLAAATRRLHDKNRSGWFQLLNLIPVVGQIILFVFFLQKGDQTENNYGPVPQE
jgi:uncharacterized membrane protein YhaH (DUF805 family)